MSSESSIFDWKADGRSPSPSPFFQSLFFNSYNSTSKTTAPILMLLRMMSPQELLFGLVQRMLIIPSLFVHLQQIRGSRISSFHFSRPYLQKTSSFRFSWPYYVTLYALSHFENRNSIRNDDIHLRGRDFRSALSKLALQDRHIYNSIYLEKAREKFH